MWSLVEAVADLRGPLPHLIQHVDELVDDPNEVSVRRWFERGFAREAVHWPTALAGGLLVMTALATDTSGLDRVVQRFAVHLAKRGRVTSVFLYTYSAAVAGTPGRRLERITWNARRGAHRAFLYEPPQRTGAFSAEERATLQSDSFRNSRRYSPRFALSLL